MKNIFLLLLSLTIVGLSSPASAKAYLTQKDISQSPTGYVLKSDKYGEFRVLGVKTRLNKKSECKVDTRSLTKEMEKMMLGFHHPKQSAIRVTVKLKMMGSTIDDSTICSGPGNDCFVELELSI